MSCSLHIFTKNEFRISADLHVKSNEVIVKETMHAAAVEQISHMEQQSQISQVSCFEQNPFKIEISGWPLEAETLTETIE